MRTNLTLTYLFSGILASLLAVSCAKEKIDEQYVKLEQIACSFYGSDNVPMEIKVQSNPAAWTAESNQEWLTADKSADGSTLILTAMDNDSDEERKATITVTAGEAVQNIKVTQLGLYVDMPRYCALSTYEMGAVISPSGQYVGGFEATSTGGDTFIWHPLIVDTQTGEKFRCGDIPSSQFWLYQPMAMSDDGKLFIKDGQQGINIVFEKDGSYDVIQAEGYVTSPMIQGTGDGGRIWVGYARKQSPDSEIGALFTPLAWVDGEIHELKFPDKNFRGEDFWSGIMARGISADGSIIYGTTWEEMDFGMVYWTDINEKAKYVGHDVHEITEVTLKDHDGVDYQAHIANGMICSAELTKISPSGKWIAGAYRTETVTEDRYGYDTAQWAAFFNTETEKTTIVKAYNDSVGLHVTDDGIAFIGLSSIDATNCVVYDLNSGTELGDMVGWIGQNYGIKVPTGTIDYVNADKTVVFGNYKTDLTFEAYYIAQPIEEK